MSKFKYLLSFQLKKRFKSKAFYIANGIIFVLLLLVTNLNHIIKAFDKGESVSIINVVNETDKENIFDELKYLNDNSAMDNVGTMHLLKLDHYEEGSTLENILIVTMEDNILEARLLNSNLGILKQSLLSSFLNQLKYNYLLGEKLSEEEILELQTPIVLEVEMEDEDSIARDLLSIVSMILTIPIFLLITFGVQFVGGSIVEEKSSKAIEYLIANVSPEKHFFAKILTSFIFLVVQMLLIVLFGIIGGALSAFVFGSSGSGGSLNDLIASSGGFLPQEEINNMVKLIPLAIIYFIGFAGLGGLLFMVIMAFIAAISNSNEDFQQFQSPLMFLMLGGFYGGLFGTMAGTNVVVKILGYIPFFSPFMAPSLYLANIYTWYETLISLLILVGTTYIVYKLIMPAYKTSILSYDTDKFFKRIKKAFGRSRDTKKIRKEEK